MNRRFFALITTTCVIGAASTMFAACGDDSTDTTPTTDSGTLPDTSGGGNDSGGGEAAATSGTISGTVDYEGAHRGDAIYLAVFKSQVPSLADILGAGAISNPTLPGKNPYTIKNVPPGSWYLFVQVDALTNGPPPAPGPNTPLVAKPVTVVAGQTTTLDVLVTDPVTDGGTDAGDAGDAGD